MAGRSDMVPWRLVGKCKVGKSSLLCQGKLTRQVGRRCHAKLL